MNANPNQRMISGLRDIVRFLWNSISGDYKNVKRYGYYKREIKEAFEEADKDISNISIS